MGCTNRYSDFIRVLLNAVLLVTALSTTACTTATRITGSHYVHLLYQHPATGSHLNQPATARLTIVYIEGDGIPWVAHGMKPARDPTPLHALAYNLYKATPYAAWYLTRPCYNHVADAACTPLAWTHARYSDLVVDSMVSAIQFELATRPDQALILVGYSGGGTLATLIAPRVPQVAGVITIAGNLDINAWTALHGYEPMSQSLNPADSNELAMPHLALVGDRDTNVPVSILTRFLQTHPRTIVQRVATNDHVCCWEKNWPTLLDTALAKLNMGSQ